MGVGRVRGLGGTREKPSLSQDPGLSVWWVPRERWKEGSRRKEVGLS